MFYQYTAMDSLINRENAYVFFSVLEIRVIVGLLLRKDLQPPVLKTSADMFTLTCVFDAVRSTAVALTVSRYLPSSTVRDLHEAGRRIS